MKSPLAHVTGAAICLAAVPMLMAWQEWDDHDRSQKTLARDMAKDYLESCPPNAILFSFEDNDTYPLWYAQEVEGIRPDVRVVINTLSGTDWFMDQLRYKVNNSAPFDILFTSKQTMGDKLNVVYYADLPGFSKDQYYDLHDVLKDVTGSDDPRFIRQAEDGEIYHLFPTRKFKVPIDQNLVRTNGTVNAKDPVVNELHLDLPGNNYLLKNDLSILAILATNQWKRPICFTSVQSLTNLGLEKYTRLDGMAYRLVPVENGQVNNETAYNNIMKKFAYGNADKRGVYFDEENRRRLNNIKLAHAQVALSLAREGKQVQAREVLNQFDQLVNSSNFPYGMTFNQGNRHNAISIQFLQACYASGDMNLARKVAGSVRKDLEQQMRYYQSLGDGNYDPESLAANAYQYLQGKGGDLSDRQLEFAYDILSSYQLLKQVDEWGKQFQQKQSSL